MKVDRGDEQNPLSSHSKGEGMHERTETELNSPISGPGSADNVVLLSEKRGVQGAHVKKGKLHSVEDGDKRRMRIS